MNCNTEQVPLAQWSARSQKDFADGLPMVAVHNPLDLLGDAGPDRFCAGFAGRPPRLEH